MRTTEYENLRVEHFSKGTTAAAAGIALAGGLDIARTAYAAGSDELKIALVGCGGRGTGAVVDCLTSCENVRLIAMGDVFKEHAEGSLARLRKNQRKCSERNAVAKIDVPAERMFIGFDAFQKVIDAGPDIVLLATPPGFRPIALCRGHRGRQARLHGKADLRRCARLPLGDGNEQGGRRERA